MKVSSFLLLLIALLALNCGPEQSKVDNAVASKKIDSLLNVMTIEEKIGQLNLPSAGAFTTGAVESSERVY